MDKIEKILFSFLIGLGLIFTFLIPPFQKPDENRHYYQVEALSRGTFNCLKDDKGTYLPLPTDVIDFPSVLKIGDIAHNDENKFARSLFSRYPYDSSSISREYNWCSTSIIGYFPNIPGVIVGHVVNSKLASVYLSRFSSLIFFLFLFSYAYRRTPRAFRTYLYFYALTPMTIHQVTAISYDTLLLTLIPLIYSYVVAPPTSPYLMWFSLVTVSFVKVTYAPLLLLGFWFGCRHFWKYTIIFLISLILLMRIPAPHFSEYPQIINPSAQANIILHHPLNFLSASFATINLKFVEIFTSLVGNFGWLDYSLHPFWGYIYFAAYFFLIVRSAKLKFSLAQIVMIISVIIISVGAIFGSLYLYWTQPGFNLVSGIQGRYFLPLLPFIMLVFAYIWQNYRKYFLAILPIIFALYLISLIYHRYYDYSQYGVNDPDNAQIKNNLTNDHYTLTIPGVEGKLTGFYYSTYEPVPPARYLLLDRECHKVLRAGYLQNLVDISAKGEHREVFAPVWVGEHSCLKIETLGDQGFSVTAIAPLYLIPSVTP